MIFSCSEQIYQYEKALFLGRPDVAEKIGKGVHPKLGGAMHPAVMKRMAKVSANQVLQSKWHEGEKFKVMKLALRAKFGQNDNLREYLLDTGDAHLLEASPFDRVWGIGFASHNFTAHVARWGRNHLGILLAEIREGARYS